MGVFLTRERFRPVQDSLLGLNKCSGFTPSTMEFTSLSLKPEDQSMRSVDMPTEVVQRSGFISTGVRSSDDFLCTPIMHSLSDISFLPYLATSEPHVHPGQTFSGLTWRSQRGNPDPKFGPSSLLRRWRPPFDYSIFDFYAPSPPVVDTLSIHRG